MLASKWQLQRTCINSADILCYRSVARSSFLTLLWKVKLMSEPLGSFANKLWSMGDVKATPALRNTNARHRRVCYSESAQSRQRMYSASRRSVFLDGANVNSSQQVFRGLSHEFDKRSAAAHCRPLGYPLPAHPTVREVQHTTNTRIEGPLGGGGTAHRSHRIPSDWYRRRTGLRHNSCSPPYSNGSLHEGRPGREGQDECVAAELISLEWFCSVTDVRY